MLKKLIKRKVFGSGCLGNNQNMENIPTDILPQTKHFVSLFSEHLKDEVVPWTGKDYVGFSILKKYPKDSSFIPIKDKKGNIDSVALIKIGYSLKKAQELNDDKVLLSVEVHKASRYILYNHFYRSDDENSPPKEFIDQSKSSPQPIDLAESNRYFFYFKKDIFFDSKTKKYIKPNKIVKDVFKRHLNTLTNWFFRGKMKTKELLTSSIEPTINKLIYLNKILFGKEIKKNKDDFSTGTFSPYKHINLIDSIGDKMKVLNSDFPITYQSARTFFTFITIVFLVFYFKHYDSFGLVGFINEANKNNLFIISVTSFALIFLDKVTPHLVLELINLLIKLRLYLWNLRININ